MNPAVLVALNLINEIFVANGNQEITGTNSNPVLQSILTSLYGITGDPEYLTTFDKTNLVSAINEVNDLVRQINSIKLFSGSANPNSVPPNGGDFELRDFYAQTSGGGNVGLWIYTGVNPNGWVNLNQRDIAWVAALPTTGLTNVQYNRVADNTIWRWFAGNGGGDPARWIQMGSKYTQIYPDLDSFPYPGDSDTFYIARDTRRGYIWNSGISAYAPLYESDVNLDDYYTKEESDELFILESEKGVADGVATLGSDGKVPPEQLPEISSNAVSYEAQTPTLEQQAQARENIGVTASFYDQKWIWNSTTNPTKEFTLDFEPTQVIWTYNTNTPIWMDENDFEIEGTTLRILTTDIKDGAIIRIGYYHE